MKKKTAARVHWLRRIAINKRLNGCLFLIIFVPICSVCIFSYHTTFQDAKEKISFFSSEIISKTSESIEQMAETLESISIDIAYNDTLQDTLLQYDTLSEFERYQREMEMTSICTKKLMQHASVTDVLALTEDQEPFRCYGDMSFRFRPSLFSLQQIHEKMEGRQAASIYYPVNRSFENRIFPEAEFDRGNGFVLCRKIKRAENGAEIGTLLIRVDESQLQQEYSRLNLGEGSEFVIVNGEGQIFSSSSGDEPGTVCPELLDGRTADGRLKGVKIKWKGKECLGLSRPIEGTDWTVWGLIPYSFINRSSRMLGISIVWIGLACIALASSIASALSRSIGIPLKRLECAMESVVRGEFNDSQLWDDAPDELGSLSRKFVHMVREQELQVERLIEEEKHKRSFEIQALQRQVNPHFMSNTLNTIAYLAHLQGTENIEKVTLALIHLMLASSGKNESFITVEQELSYVADYLYIQEFRFGNLVQVEYKIEPEIRQALLPCFLLQPIVENALLHGIRDMEIGGKITIQGERQGNSLLFVITDNGVGMDREQIAKALREGPEDRSSHFSAIGIRNINDRIHLLFGDAYGLLIESEVGRMTSVRVTLPCLQKEKKDENLKRGI